MPIDIRRGFRIRPLRLFRSAEMENNDDMPLHCVYEVIQDNRSSILPSRRNIVLAKVMNEKGEVLTFQRRYTVSVAWLTTHLTDANFQQAIKGGKNA